jgi:DNA (cytosine-5)-methyltransferase 1
MSDVESVSKRPRLLDLFCGAGGAAVGYHRAGFDVVGVDIKPQPRYPFEFVQQDALDYLHDGLSPVLAAHFDVIHASPPCQAYIRGGLTKGLHPDLLPWTRELLEQVGLPWIIENVPGAPMRADALLCGSMFALPIRRHRWFETSWATPILTPPCDHSGPIVGVYGHPHGKAGAGKGMLPGSLSSWSEALEIDWMTAAELADAIPPAYTEWVGTELMAHLKQEERIAAFDREFVPACDTEGL